MPLASAATLQELAEVPGRSRFDPYLSHSDRNEFIPRLSGVTRIGPILRRIPACGDARGDKFLEVAIAGDARAIITGEKDLLALHPFHGVAIVSPSAVLAEG